MLWDIKNPSPPKKVCFLTSFESGDNFASIPPDGDFFHWGGHRTRVGGIDDVSGTYHDFGEVLGRERLRDSATL